MQVLEGTEYNAFVALMQNMKEHVQFCEAQNMAEAKSGNSDTQQAKDAQ